MRGNPCTELQLATGGKELDLCVWDGNNLSKPTFQAKNVSFLKSTAPHQACGLLTLRGYLLSAFLALCSTLTVPILV